MNTCCFCLEEIGDNDKIFWIGFDKPYCNILIHKSHILDGYSSFVAENAELLLSNYNKALKMEKDSRKTHKNALKQTK